MKLLSYLRKRKFLVVLLFGWVVFSESGKQLSGVFRTLKECQEAAKKLKGVCEEVYL